MVNEIISKYVIAGGKVDIRPIKRVRLSDGEPIPVKSYQTQIYDVISEDRIEVLMPMEKTKIVLLPIEGEYDLFFYVEKGIYQCKAKIVDRSRRNNTYLLVMDLISNLRKEQRREFFRFSCALAMNSRALEQEEVVKVEKEGIAANLVTPNLPIKRSVIVDISGGGLRFVADYAYEEGSIIACKYQLDMGEGMKSYELTGKVLSVKENINRPGIYEHRVQYINIGNDDREEIIRYIFEEERKKLKKTDR